MKKSIIISTLLTIVISAISIKSYAVQFHTVDCGNGNTIIVSDSEYNPATNALLCLKSAHKKPSAKAKRKPVFAQVSQGTRTVKRTLSSAGKSDQNGASTVDHSDIILMLQGCECISPSCVAYTCPAGVDVP